MHRPSLPLAVTAALSGLLLTLPATLPAAAAGSSPTVQHSGLVTEQDVASSNGSETDTVVEPDVEVNPTDQDNAIAAAHDSRYPDGGAVDISVAWTKDGGATWQHAPVQGVTRAAGGPYERASDPVVAFGPDGTAYLSILAINVSNCDSAVVVLRSRDGGTHWSSPSYAHRSSSCNYSDDKNWIIVDNGARSPHRGRVYQFWTPFLFDSTGSYTGSPQAVRWSDDKGRTWSATSYVTPQTQGTQNSQPMIRDDGTIVDTFYDFGVGGRSPDLVPGASPEKTQTLARLTAAAGAKVIDPAGDIVATTSTNGGRTWSPTTLVTSNGGGYADGVRCCLFSATIDAVSQRMYVAWEGGVRDTDPVYTASSTNGVDWSSPVRVSRNDVSGVQNVNVDVSARDRAVYVSYGRRTQPDQAGGFVRQQLATSTDAGLSFGVPQTVGPRSVLRYSAQSRGHFPGDYIGSAVSRDRLYLVWAVSSKPPASSGSPYHQVIWGVTLAR